MEQQMELVEEKELQLPSPVTAKQTLLRLLLAVSLTLSILTFGVVAYLYYLADGLKKVNNEQAEQLEELHNRNKEFEEGYNSLSDAFEQTNDGLLIGFFFLTFQHAVEGSVKTDEFLVKKVLLDTREDDKLYTAITVSITSQMAPHYNGDGTFDISDSELRAMCKELIAAVKKQYFKPYDRIPEWDDSNVHLAFDDYIIGNTLTGEFELVGEKFSPQ